ncbi:MAG: hypothetical protein GY953_08085 [bacterium]|nr:hypothetical protein [bacterium]
MVPNLPVDGREVFVRLLWRTGEDWHYDDYTFKSAGDAELVSPVPGSTLPGPTVTFRWSAGVGLDEYVLEVGTTFEGKDISVKSWGSETSATLTDLPVDGRPIYVKLLWRRGRRWYWSDHEYRAAAQP